MSAIKILLCHITRAPFQSWMLTVHNTCTTRKVGKLRWKPPNIEDSFGLVQSAAPAFAQPVRYVTTVISHNITMRFVEDVKSSRFYSAYGVQFC